MKQAYIVISDVHLGNEKCNHKDFCDFLEWIHDLEKQPAAIKCKDKEVTIKKPDKIILLGDILDLWNPKNGDRNNVIKDFIRPFYLFSNINCDKIYIVGNHDDSLGELEGKGNFDILNNGKKFVIYNRHYPKKNKKSGKAHGIKIGNRSYFFLHGHQFDKNQAILKYINRIWNPITWFQDLFNVKFTKKILESKFCYIFRLVTCWEIFFKERFPTI